MTPSCIPAAHPLDVAVAWLSRRSKLFFHGWGDEGLFAQLSDTVSYFDPPSQIALHWSTGRERRGITRRDGTFLSPLELLPEHTRTVHVRAWTRAEHRAACVILAASRDEGFRGREHIFGGLIARGLDLYFLENPFYGSRRTPQGPSHMTISDHGLMALGMVLEARALLEHLHPRYPKLVVAGYSMGGHMAAITAAVTPFAVGCAALATGASASSIYTHGLLSWSVDLDALGGALDPRAPAATFRSGGCHSVSTPGAARRRRNCGLQARWVRIEQRDRTPASALEGKCTALDSRRPFLRARDQPSRSVRLCRRSRGQTLKDT